MAPKIRVPANFGVEHINSPVHGNLLLKLKDGQEIRTNSMIMSLNSPVIAKLTSELFPSSLDVDDFSKPAVECFVEAMYSGEVYKLKKDIFEDVNKMAHVFDVSWLTKRCLKFYKTDILKFESNSYEEILFACEIARRALTLKQSKLVGYFVKNIAFTGMGKTIFLQRYMARFAKLSRSEIDMSLAIANKDVGILANFLTHYINIKLECKELDKNSLYLLQRIDGKKLARNNPSQYCELACFISEVSAKSDSSEVKEVLGKFVAAEELHPLHSSTDESHCDELSDDSESDEEDPQLECEPVKNLEHVATQTADLPKVKSDWVVPHGNKYYPLLPNESFEILTTQDKPHLCIGMWFEASKSKGSQHHLQSLGIRCEDAGSGRWSYYVNECTPKQKYNSLFLNNVPRSRLKHWVVTKTAAYLKISCNRVTVLDFKFSTDCQPGYRLSGSKIWAMKSNYVRFWACYDSVSIAIKAVSEV